MSEGLESTSITVAVNGASHEVDVTIEDTLVDVLRGRLGLTSCRETCGLGVCGTCTVVIDGRAVSACLMPALHADGTSVRTAEGPAPRQSLSALQEQFVENQAFQCSFCTPGFLMSATAYLEDPTDGSVAEALSGHICRCGSYQQIVAAVEQARSRDSSHDTRTINGD